MLPQSKSRGDVPIEGLDKILEAAEAEFAERGFDGAGMKALAARAEVSQSLLHYHFGTKEKLYAAVIQNRSALINKEREALLGACDLASPTALDAVFHALFAPAIGPSGGGKAYARIFAGLIAGNERDKALVREYYDETAKKFIAAIQRCLPRLSRLEATQIYHCGLGVLATHLVRDDRIARLSGTSTAALSDQELLMTHIRFAVGGARAIQDN